MDDGWKNFHFISMAMWNILITLFSIGYGDVYTNTYLGRLIIVLLSFYGGFVISVITIVILGEFEMSKFENNSFTMMDFLVLKVGVLHGVTIQMRIRKLTKKMLFHKAKYVQAKKGKLLQKGAKAFHHARFLHFKNEFHEAVSVRSLTPGTEVQAKGRPVL